MVFGLIEYPINHKDSEEPWQGLQLKFDTGSLQAFFKPFYLLRTEFECTLTCQNAKQREELLYLITQNQPNDG